MCLAGVSVFLLFFLPLIHPLKEGRVVVVGCAVALFGGAEVGVTNQGQVQSRQFLRCCDRLGNTGCRAKEIPFGIPTRVIAAAGSLRLGFTREKQLIKLARLACFVRQSKRRKLKPDVVVA